MLLQHLLNAVATSLGTLLQHFLLTQTVPMHRPRLFVALGTGLPVAIWFVNIYILAEPHWICDFLVLLEIPLFTILFTAKGHRSKGLFSMTIFLALQMLTNYAVGMFVFPIAAGLGIPKEALLIEPLSLPMTVLCFFLYYPTALLAHRVLRKFLAGLRFSLLPLLFLIIPLSQALILYILIGMDLMSMFGSRISPIYALAILLALSADLVFCIGLQKIRKTDRFEQQIRTAQEQLNVQTSYYNQLRDNILAINQIRHDLSNQLQAAYHLLEQGEHTLARSQLDQLQSNIQKKVGPNFCANLVVDAVLSSKANLCQEQGILLDINANLPEELPIDSAHLCSAFSNLLDNSIQGVLSSKEKEKHIELRAALQSDCLVIRCSNPALPTVAKRHSGDILRPHGLGLDILRQIAAQYDGTLVTEYQNHCFEAVLILKYKNT